MFNPKQRRRNQERINSNLRKKNYKHMKRNIKEKSKSAESNTSKYLPENEMQSGQGSSKRDESQNLDDSEIITDI